MVAVFSVYLYVSCWYVLYLASVHTLVVAVVIMPGNLRILRLSGDLDTDSLLVCQKLDLIGAAQATLLVSGH